MLNCRLCDSNHLHSIIPLGKLPLANALLEGQKDQESFHNLEVMLCKNCELAQLKDLIAPKDLFSDYVYFSSNSDTMLESVRTLTHHLIPTLPKDALIVEIASNDGYLLKNYVEHGIKVLGIDPAENIAKIANQKGIETLCDFFSAPLANMLSAKNQKADIIHANNVMAHVPDINGFIQGIKILLKDKGQAIIEVPYFMDLIKKLEFDTIYHEHVYYFALKPLKKAFENHELEIFDIEKLKIHGGSLRLFVGHMGAHFINPVIESMIHEESAFGLYNLETYERFMKQLEGLKEALVSLLKTLKNSGKKIAAYGASAKGTTLLNYFGVTKDLIDFVVDRSPAKQGKLTPGLQLEILPPKELINKNISHALLLSWNFADEIMAQQKEFLDMGGKFIIPLPDVKVVP